MRTFTPLAAVAFVFAAVIAANGCSSDDTTSTSSSGGSSSGGSSGGGSSGGSSSGSDTCAKNTGTPIKTCAPVGNTTCPQTELDAYAKCTVDNCDAEYKACYGAGYATGDFNGPCDCFVQCVEACDCNDLNCRSNCRVTTQCSDCSTKLTTCIQEKCKRPCVDGG